MRCIQNHGNSETNPMYARFKMDVQSIVRVRVDACRWLHNPFLRLSKILDGCTIDCNDCEYGLLIVQSIFTICQDFIWIMDVLHIDCNCYVRISLVAQSIFSYTRLQMDAQSIVTIMHPFDWLYNKFFRLLKLFSFTSIFGKRLERYFYVCIQLVKKLCLTAVFVSRI